MSAAAGVGAAGVAALRLRLRGVPEVGVRVPESACADAAFVSGDAAVQSGAEGSSVDAWRDLPLTSLRDKLRRFAVRLGATASASAADADTDAGVDFRATACIRSKFPC